MYSGVCELTQIVEEVTEVGSNDLLIIIFGLICNNFLSFLAGLYWALFYVTFRGFGRTGYMFFC